MMKYYSILLLVVISFLARQAQAQFNYLNPSPGSIYKNPETTITIRNGNMLQKTSVQPNLFTISGSVSGMHQFTSTLTRDGKTIILTPQIEFTGGETVTVNIADGLKKLNGEMITGMAFSFQIRPDYTEEQNQMREEARWNIKRELYGEAFVNSILNPGGERLITAIPGFQLTATGNEWPEEVFFYNFNFNGTQGRNRCIITNEGDSIYAANDENVGLDFKVNHNGYLTAYNFFDGTWEMFDSTYTYVATYGPGNGYSYSDEHEFLIFPDGHYWLMIYDVQIVDMSVIVSGGQPNAEVTGCIIQEIDELGNVVFEWSSWDYFQITDAVVSINLTAAEIDYVHGNALEFDTDGNVLLSARHMNEITKIDYATGNIIWRLGGENNEFTFLNDIASVPFSYQHDIRKLPNGNFSLFNNGNNLIPQSSVAKEYSINETTMEADLIWHYEHPQVNGQYVYGRAMGNVQILPNQNRFINWGLIFGGGDIPNFTEVDASGNIVWELKFDTLTTNQVIWVSYRAFKNDWNLCSEAQNLQVNNTTQVDADLSWDAIPGATSYNLEYKEASSGTWIPVTASSSSYLLTGLTAESTYNWRVQSVCTDVNAISSFVNGPDFITDPVGIATVSETQFRFYPNPAANMVTIVWSPSLPAVTGIKLQTLSGETVYEEKIKSTDQQHQLNTESLPSATYLLHLVLENGTLVEPIIIQ